LQWRITADLSTAQRSKVASKFHIRVLIPVYKGNGYCVRYFRAYMQGIICIRETAA